MRPMVMGVVFDLIVISWPYVLATCIKERGDRWLDLWIQSNPWLASKASRGCALFSVVHALYKPLVFLGVLKDAV